MKIKLYIFLISVIFIGCSPKKNNFFTRLYQPIPTAYNILYNGNLAFEEGKNALNLNFNDNFFEILPIEPISLTDETSLTSNNHFERAEEKATKAIQRHSMSFDGQQRNRKIGDAYLLLGKSRYYNQRYLSALQAFDHLLINFKKERIRHEAFIWREKTNIHLNREKIAIKNLEDLLSDTSISKQNLSEAQATIAQAFINLKEYEKAVFYLTQAAENTHKNIEKGRYFFISAQLYEHLQKKELALEYYKKVNKLSRRIPRFYWVEAHLARIKNTSLEEKNKAISFLNKLENDFEYKPFLGSIYFSHAELINEKNNEAETISLLKKALKHANHSILKQKTNHSLAELYFSQKQYALAHKHYDSTLVYLPKNTLTHLFTRRKRDNLQEVARLENAINQTDSILSLLKLSKKEKEFFFENQANNLNEIQNKILEKEIKNNHTNTHSTFYFYNINALTKGKQDFIKTFGNRKLTDNWRWENKITFEENSEKKSEENTSILVHSLPNPSEIELLFEQKNKNLYQLGILYSEKFNDKELALNRFLQILENSPSADLEEKTLYQISQIAINEQVKQRYTQFLTERFPASPYTKIVQGEVKVNNEFLKNKFSELNKLFENQEFGEILQQIKQHESKYKASAFAPEWELLKTKVEGRLNGVIFYRKALIHFKENFPNSALIQEVNTILKHLTQWEKIPNFEIGNATSWKIVYPFDNQRFEFLTNWLHHCGFSNLTASADVYTLHEKWIVLHGIQSENQAKHISQQLQNEHFIKPIFIIESENYEIVQKYKNSNEYLKIK